MEQTLKPTDSISLNKIKVVGFLTAIRENDKSHISEGVTQKEFENLCEQYMESEKPKPGNIEKRVEKLAAKMIIIQGCLIVFESLPADEEMMEVLRDQGFKIERETYFQDLKVILSKYKNLEFKHKNEKSRLPKKAEKSENAAETSIYDMLTALASGLELSLNFETMTVGEFVSWRRQLRRKQESIKQSSNKSNNGKRK